jgi:hypothetical protein
VKTTLPPETLARLAAEGRAEAARSPFVNPHTITKTEKLLRDRGREWAESVLMRSLERRSLISDRFPWLGDGEPETLVLAAEAEWGALENAAQI